MGKKDGLNVANIEQLVKDALIESGIEVDKDVNIMVVDVEHPARESARLAKLYRDGKIPAKQYYDQLYKDAENYAARISGKSKG